MNYKKIPTNLHFKTSNPTVDFANSPFFVNKETQELRRQGTPRRAGVTSLGMGGTNAHVIVEESPGQEAPGESRPYQLLLLSARSDSALKNMTGNLGDYLKEHKEINLADVAYTLALGRRDLNYRRAILCQHAEDAEVKLGKLTPGWVFDGSSERVDRPVVFMFSGQGAQYVNMGKGLYLHEKVFRENMDKCAQLLAPQLGMDVLELIYPHSEEDAAECSEKLKETRLTQPVLFMMGGYIGYPAHWYRGQFFRPGGILAAGHPVFIPPPGEISHPFRDGSDL